MAFFAVSKAPRSVAAVFAVLPVLALLVSGCKVISIEQDREMRAQAAAGFNAERYVADIWNDRAKRLWLGAETPLDNLVSRIGSDLDAAGAKHGRQAGEGSPWTFIVKGEGRVTSIDKGRRGQIAVALPGSGTTALLQAGPVVSGSALRDSLPFIQFNDFANQLVFADVGRALTGKALAETASPMASLKVGDTVRFGGALAVSEAGQPLLITPYRVERVAGVE